MTMNQPVVTILYKSLPQYRAPFFEGLRVYLANRGVQLRLIYGQPSDRELSKRDTVHIDWAEPVSNRIFEIGSSALVWQPVLWRLRGSDLIIVEQANSLLINYVLVALNALGLRKVAFWGHGRNYQAMNAGSLAERMKALLSRHVYWWFAYNESSARVVRDLGFSGDRITLVQNSIDTRDLIRTRQSVDRETELLIRRALDVADDAQLCMFVGGMYPEKRLEFLIEACDLIRQNSDSFEMVFVGSGPSASMVAAASSSRPWLHHVGPQFGDDKARIACIAELLLMPGLVGLAIVDSFALQVPMVTTDIGYHSPEIEYLVDGVNGIMIPETDDVAAYAERVSKLLASPELLIALKAGCAVSADQYTMAAMVRNFGEGVLCALDVPT